MGDVIDLRPKGWTDDLLSLPSCPIRACSRCGREDYSRWCSKLLGCSECAPENEEATLEIAGLSSRVFLLEEVLRQVHAGRSFEQVARNLGLELPPPEQGGTGHDP